MPRPNGHRSAWHGSGGGIRRGAGARLALFYAAVFVGPGVTLPFLPAFLADRGLDPGWIATVLAAQHIARLLAGPALGRAADQLGDRRRAAAAAAAAGLVAALAVAASSGPLALAIAAAAAAAAMSPMVSLGDAMALRAAGQGLCDFGRVRAAGSVSFVAGTLAGGVAVRHLGASVVPFAWAAGFAAIWAAARALPDLGTPSARGRGLGFGLLRSRVFLLLLLASGLTQGSHAMHYAFSVIFWDTAGIGPDLSGVLWTVGVVAEIALLWAGRGPARRLGPVGLLAAGAAAGVLRWGGTALTTDPWLLAPLQALHALSFGATMLGAAGLIGRIVPPELGATAQALHGAFGPGLASLVLTAASGPLYARLGGRGFLAMAAVCAAALIPTALLARREEAWREDARGEEGRR